MKKLFLSFSILLDEAGHIKLTGMFLTKCNVGHIFFIDKAIFKFERVIEYSDLVNSL